MAPSVGGVTPAAHLVGPLVRGDPDLGPDLHAGGQGGGEAQDGRRLLHVDLLHERRPERVLHVDGPCEGRQLGSVRTQKPLNFQGGGGLATRAGIGVK